MTFSTKDLPSSGILESNPIWLLQEIHKSCPDRLPDLLDAFKAEGIKMPPKAAKFFQNSGGPEIIVCKDSEFNPGFVGLLFDRTRGLGFVTPLKVQSADEWYVSPNLPFNSDDIECSMKLLFNAAGGDLDLYPDIFGFDIRDQTGCHSDGTSMTIAALLAVLVVASNREQNVPFQRACAVVELADNDTILRPVESIKQKLEGFVREYGRGSLLVCHKKCQEAKAFETHFDEVWRVESMADLARYADETGLLGVFRSKTEWNTVQYKRALTRLQRLADYHLKYQEALKGAKFLRDHPRNQTVPPKDIESVNNLIRDMYRHLGLLSDAEKSAREKHERVKRNPERFSYDIQASAASDLAAALFASHSFQDACSLLQPWFEKLKKDPLIVSPQTRVMIFNTLGRAEVMVFNTLGRAETFCGEEWESKFRESLRLQEWTDPPGIARTTCYLAHAFLRHNRLPEAEEEIRKGKTQPGANDFSRWELSFLRADLARRQEETWNDTEMDKQEPLQGRVAHPFGKYFQATARQSKRAPKDRIDRFEKAIRFMKIDVVESETTNLLAFLALSLRLRLASECGSTDQWSSVGRDLSDFFQGQGNSDLVKYYAPVWKKIGAAPNIKVSEQFLDQNPYF